MSITNTTIDINDVTYAVADHGAGERTILLLHGMPDTSSMWRAQVPALVDAGYRVIAPDMLGYGRTSKPQDAQRYQGAKIIEDLLGLIDALGVSTVDVVGHDWGAFASWELVLNHPERFNRHVTLSVGHPEVLFGEINVQSAKANWYMYLNGQENAPALYLLHDCAFLRNIILPSHPEIDEVCDRMRDPIAMRAMLNWDRGNELVDFYAAYLTGELSYPKCTVPTMGIWSRGDTYLWEAQMTASADHMAADWRYETVDGSHWIPLDQPKELNRLLLDWLR